MNTLLFDLDGTLLPLDVDEFIKKYFGLMKHFLDEKGYDGKKVQEAIFKSTMIMFKNNGQATNETVFWKSFTHLSGIQREEIEKDLTVFYQNEFNLIHNGKQNEHMIQSVHCLKEKGYRLVLATNPLFPAIATYARIRWAGLNPDDFEWITTYENASYCKPNPAYFEEVLQKANVNIKDCIMIGNDVKEDGAITQLGVDLYLIEDYLLNTDNLPLESAWYGNSKQFLEYVKELPVIG